MENIYRIIGGQLYKNNVKEKLVFGDTEQIKFLKEFEKKIEDATNIGIDLNSYEQDEDIIVYFRCVCGRIIDYIADYGGKYTDDYCICGFCGRKYEIDDYDDVAILIPK